MTALPGTAQRRSYRLLRLVVMVVAVIVFAPIAIAYALTQVAGSTR